MTPVAVVFFPIMLVRGKLRSSRVFLLLGVCAVITPFLMNTAGWLVTENGRQPWIVQGLQETAVANSPAVTSTDIWISLIVFVLGYIVLGAADLILMLRYSRHGLAQAAEPSGGPGDAALPRLVVPRLPPPPQRTPAETVEPAAPPAAPIGGGGGGPGSGK